MERNNGKEGTHEEELCSFCDMNYTVCYCSEDHNKLNPLHEIFGDHPSSRPEDVTKNNDHEKLDEERDEESNRTSKRQRAINDRLMMEKKRRQGFRDKVDILQGMIPYSTKSDLAGKLDNIIEYIKSLKHQADIMAMAYAATPVYTSPYYGAQAPCMSAWGYYAPGIPIMPQQNMPYIPQYDQVHGMAPRDQTKP